MKFKEKSERMIYLIKKRLKTKTKLKDRILDKKEIKMDITIKFFIFRKSV